jgi:hypothetical protein
MPPSESSDNDDEERSTTTTTATTTSHTQSKNSESNAPMTSKPHLYEQLGAPIVLYRHKPSYTSYTSTGVDGLSIPKIPTCRIDQTEIDSKNKLKASRVSGRPIDVDSMFIPEPWSKRVPSSLKSAINDIPGDVVKDAHHCADILTRADRARVRRNFQSSLGFQNWNGQQDLMTMVNDVPVDKNHYLMQRLLFNSGQYLLSNPTDLPKDVMLARNYRQERVHSSPLDGYCTPFSRQAIRYGFGDEREFPLIPKEERSRVYHEGTFCSNIDGSNVYENYDHNLGENHLKKDSNDDIVDHDNDNDIASARNRLTINESKKLKSEEIDINDGSSSSSKDENEENMDTGVLDDEKNPYTLIRGKSHKRKRDSTKIGEAPRQGHVNDDMSYYGNCLSLLPCICGSCREALNDKNNKRRNSNVDPNMFILHPTGDSISLSSLTMPFGTSKWTVSDNEDLNLRGICNIQVDVGGKPLQIESCTDILNQNEPIPNNITWLFVVRTAYHCSIIRCTFVDIGGKVIKGKKINELSHQQQAICTGMYDMKLVFQTDLNPGNEKNISHYECLRITTKPSTCASDFTYPTWAVLTCPVVKGSEKYHHYNREANVIHRIQYTYESKIQKHRINNLRNICDMKYSLNHPMVLWSAATPRETPSLIIGKHKSQRPMIGFGNQLYSIDLRCDKAHYLWSPSKSEFMLDGIHSVSGILTDQYDPYSLIVKSLTSASLHQLDVRMPCRTIFTWKLPGLCNDFSSSLSSPGIYGSGSLLINPLAYFGSQNKMHCPVLSVDQHCGGLGVQLYQCPTRMPRFQTPNLEMSMSNGLGMEGDTSCFATSSFFPIAESIPVCGLAAFYSSTASILDEPRLHDAKSTLCVITASCVGDLCAQTMLIKGHTEEAEACETNGNPVGSCYINVPKSGYKKLEQLRDNCFSRNGNLIWSLDNQFPIKTSSISKHHVAARLQCRKFETVQLKSLPKQDIKDSGSECKSVSSVHHPISDTFMGIPSAAPCQLKINNQLIMQETNVAVIDDYRTNDEASTNLSTENNLDLNTACIEHLKESWL